jgi:enhancer of polycomb-like protein
MDSLQMQRPLNQLRIPMRADGRPAEADLVQLSDALAEKENEIQREIEAKVAQHRKWNLGYIDLSREPLSPEPEQGLSSGYCTARAEYLLPTPPESVSSEDWASAEADSPVHTRDDPITVRYASPTRDGPFRGQISYRRRIGRGGRVWIDRRRPRSLTKDDVDERVYDRFKYDQDDEDEQPTYEVDQYASDSMRFRASILSQRDPHHVAQVRRAQHDIIMANGQSTAGIAVSPKDMQSQQIQQMHQPAQLKV